MQLQNKSELFQRELPIKGVGGTDCKMIYMKSLKLELLR